jgi:hypothetical protein
MSNEALRWRNYFLRQGQHFDDFWKSFLAEQERNVLFVLGHGFDSRMCDGIECILRLGGKGKRDVILIAFHESPESASHAHVEQRKCNGERLANLVAGHGVIRHREITMFSDDGRRVGARNVAKEFNSCAEFRPYTDVVVDISALPRGLYLPLLSKFLALFDFQKEDDEIRNLHVIVSHSPTTDSAIVDEGLEESASYLFGFAAAALENESTSGQPKIWIPVLGKGQQAQLERIHTLVTPAEICPLLPSPAEDPREGDSIMIEYRELLFDQLRVEPRNIIYAAESNPFEVYRQIMRSILHYDRALKPLGGCKVALSAMSSKLASIGVLLAAYELGHRDPKVTVGVAHVESQGYSVLQGAAGRVTAPILFTMWLSGDCYAA